uniref:Uncharacterized protein n=1 Tax=Rhizophora mucronata TaxID=61149 RepID=A0A2P2NN45_RHIMU
MSLHFIFSKTSREAIKSPHLTYVSIRILLAMTSHSKPLLII